jgi:hypothetical protein
VCLASNQQEEMEAVCSSKLSGNFYHTKRCHNPEDSTFHSQGYSNFKSNKNDLCWVSFLVQMCDGLRNISPTNSNFEYYKIGEERKEKTSV